MQQSPFGLKGTASPKLLFRNFRQVKNDPISEYFLNHLDSVEKISVEPDPNEIKKLLQYLKRNDNI